jgi:acyl-CoA synthetase (AMP-forming)/AMP-acid ligase II
MNFGECLTIQSYRVPDKIALEDDAKSITFRKLNERVNSLAHGLLELGLKKGDIVCQLQGNTIEHVELIFAIAKLGMIRLPLNPRAGKSEFIHIINTFEPKALVFEEEFSAVIVPLLPQVKSSHNIYIGSSQPSDTIAYEGLATKFPICEPDVSVEEGEPFFIQSTSGTTGLPKAAMLSQGGLIRRALIRAMDLNCNSKGIYLAVTALANTASVFYGLSQLYCGGTVILRDRFDALETVQTIEKKRITNISMVPVMWERVLNLANLKDFDLSSIEIAMSYGAPLHQATREKIIKNVTPNLFESFGITETGPITILYPRDQLKKLNCVGQPTMHTQIRILDENGQDLPIGKAGEIVAQTPYLFVGYLKNPQETAKALRAGWYYTGDIGRFDEDNYLYILGRSKEMIISGGYNIYAEEVERVVAAHPKVQEVAVIAVPDEKWGESVKAVVILKPGIQATAMEIIDFCKDNLASYKKPQSVDFVSSLPRVGADKIAKGKLREKYWAGFERKVH